MNELTLNSEIIYSDKQEKVKKAIILLHGYGGDGKDISVLSLNWKNHLKNTVILCPDAKEKCKISPSGFQWFDLSIDDKQYIINESLKSEILINDYLISAKEKYNLRNKDICLSGFSQGCMMAINIGLTSNEKYGCIVGFSGKIIDKESLSKRIKSRTKTYLLHGKDDSVVPVNDLLEAKDFLMRNKIQVITKIIENCDHSISTEASSSALKYINNNFLND